MSEAERNKQLVGGAYDAMRAGDVKGFLGVLAEDVVVHEPEPLPYGGTYRGRAAFVQALPAAGAVLDVGRLEVLELLADGDKVVALLRLAVRGGPGDALVAEHWTLCDGRAVELRVFWSDPTLVPAPA